jgi:hypothetical protein
MVVLEIKWPEVKALATYVCRYEMMINKAQIQLHEIKAF